MNNCLECNKETKNPKFCSISCSVKTQRRNEPRKNKTRICYLCGNSFEYTDLKQRFCSRSCSATFNNLKRSKKDKAVGKCLYCEKIIYGHSKRNNKFCSRECSHKNKTKNIVDAWIIKPDSATQIQGLSSAIKKYLIKQSKNKCSQCGWGEINPITGRSPLEVDHIDGNCYNNDPSNLRVLCPNCHSLTPTYKALNKNSKRKYR